MCVWVRDVPTYQKSKPPYPHPCLPPLPPLHLFVVCAFNEPSCVPVAKIAFKNNNNVVRHHHKHQLTPGRPRHAILEKIQLRGVNKIGQAI